MSTPRTTASSQGHFPHIYVILAAFILLAGVSTWLLPGGQFERVPGPDGRTMIDPASFEYTAGNPAGPTDLMLAIPRGLVAAAPVVFFTFMIGGLFAVIRRTGLIELGVGALTRRFAGRGIWVVPVLMGPFAVVATLIGTQELSLVYVPVIMPLLIALGFDSVVVAAVALCATTAGFSAGVFNPINTGLGQQIAGVSLYSGLGLRLATFVGFLALAVAFTWRYARQVQRAPGTGLLADEPGEADKRARYAGLSTPDHDVPPRATRRQKLAGGVLALLAVLLVYGVLSLGWFMLEMSGLFIVIGVAVGVVAGLRLNVIAESFNDGFREVLVGAMIAGVARAVAVVLEQGQVMDTLVHGLGTVVGELPGFVSAVGMLLAQLGFNFVVPSGSGQALVTMPIMAPLADLVGVTRQTAVLAYQLGDGIGNILYPTSGYFMATLALAGVPWQRWLRFFWPLFLAWVALAMMILVVAQGIGWTG